MAQLPRPFDYSFAMSQQARQQPGAPPVSGTVPSEAWAAMSSASDPSNSLLYVPNMMQSQDASSLFFGPPQNPAMSGQSQPLTPQDPAFYQYDALADPLAQGGLSGVIGGALPNPAFAATGLPFPGLEFIRNYTAEGLPGSPDDSLWQMIDSRVFNYDPEVPWTLGDAHLPPIEEQQM
jgi:hypothetical protein